MLIGVKHNTQTDRNHMVQEVANEAMMGRTIEALMHRITAAKHCTKAYLLGIQADMW